MKRMPMKAIHATMNILEHAPLYEKLLCSGFFSVVLSPFFMLFRSLMPFLVPDATFMLYLGIAVIVDTLTGMLKWWGRKRFDLFRLLWGMMKKVLICYLALQLFHAMGSLEEFKRLPDLHSWFMLTGKMTIMIYVAGSALLNMHFITGGTFPPAGIMLRMKQFNSTADLTKLTGSVETPAAPTPETPEG